jgi:Luciferase-like monooxygenase
MTKVRSAVWLPIFDDLAEPAVIARLAAEAEEAGWHGGVRVGPPALASTSPAGGRPVDHARRDRHRHRTPAARRDGHAARPAAASQSRQGNRDAGPAQRWPPHLGIGLGSDRFGNELSKTGESLDDRQRGRMLDESLEILTAAWSGEPVHHHGEHYTVDDIEFLPRPIQQPAPIHLSTDVNVNPVRPQSGCFG